MFEYDIKNSFDLYGEPKRPNRAEEPMSGMDVKAAEPGALDFGGPGVESSDDEEVAQFAESR